MSVCLRTHPHLGTLCRRTEFQHYTPTVGASGRERYVCYTIVVPGRVTIIMTIKTPGLVVPSKLTVTPLSSPCDSSVCHSYPNISFPLYLVTVTSQTLSTHHLGVKSLWVIRIRLVLSNPCHLSVVIRQREESVGSVWVQCGFTGI